MSRETSPCIVGDWWLDKRRDGKSPDIWQAATYKRGSRQVVYRTTKCRGLDDATTWLFAFVDEQRSKRPQTVEAAKLVPALFTYWEEHGKAAERPDSKGAGKTSGGREEGSAVDTRHGLLPGLWLCVSRHRF